MAGLIVYGAGGHAKVVIDAIEVGGGAAGLQLADDRVEAKGTSFFGYRVLGGRHELLGLGEPRPKVVPAIGDNASRLAALSWLRTNDFVLETVVHPSVRLGRGVRIGDGAFLAAGVVVNADTSIGEGAIINTGASVDHDCLLDEGVHVAPGCHICGNVTIGAGTLLGAGTVVIPGVRIGAAVVVGAGSTVLHDVPDGARVAGSPAKAIR
jgi:sugar O-acyltransferase (sialic acid O-acetyltransferase NeuD family)